MLWAAIDQMPQIQKLIAQGAIGLAAVCLVALILLRVWIALRGNQ